MSDDAVGGAESDGNEDIYKDIGDFHFDKELTKLEESNKAHLEEIAKLTEKIKELTESNLNLQEVNNILSVNISILLKTAKAEIARKQLVIDDLRKKVEGLNRKDWNDRRDEVKSYGVCKYCDKEEETKNGQIEIEDGEIVQDVSDEKSSDSERGRRGTSDDKGKKNYIIDDGRRRSERLKERSSDSSLHSHKSYKSSYQHLSHHSSSNRKRHLYDPPDRRRHSDRSKRSLDEWRYSSRSDRSRYSKDTRERDRREEKYDRTRRGHSSSKNRDSSSLRKENKSKYESESKVRREKHSAKEAEKAISVKENSSNKVILDPEAKQRTKGRESEKSDSRVSEKCDVVKKLNIEEYNQRRGFKTSVRKESEETFTRQSVLADLYNEPHTSRFSYNLREISRKSTEEAAGSGNEPAEYADWSSDESCTIQCEKKTEPVKKQQTLYSKRMEAKLQKQVKEEELALKVEKNEKTDVQNNVEFNDKRAEKECISEKSVELEQDTKKSEDHMKEERTEIIIPENAETAERENLGKEEETNELGNDIDEGKFTIEKTKDRGNDVTEEIILTEGNENISDKSGCEEMDVASEKVPDDCSELSEPVETIQTPEQSSGECMVQKVLQSEEPSGIKEFSPLKNNYKLSKISPAKPVPKQHILEYYSLKPSAQQLSNIEPEILDFSLSLPETPGKNFLHSFSTMTDIQESPKDVDDGSVKLKKLEEGKVAENNVDENEDRVSGDKDICAAVSESVTPELVLSSEGERRTNLSDKENSIMDTPIGKTGVISREIVEQKTEVEQTNEEPGASENRVSRKNVCRTRKRGSIVEEPERSYQIRTRSRNNSFNTTDQRINVGCSNLNSKKKKMKANEVENGEVGDKEGKRKRRSSTSDEEEDAIVLRRTKTVKKSKTESRGRSESSSKEVESLTSEESKTEEKEAEKGVPDDITSFELFKTATEDAAEERADAGGVESRMELAKNSNIVEDLSLSNFQVTTLNSTMNITSHVLCLETPSKCAGKFKHLTINEETVMQIEEEKSKTSLPSVGNSADSSTFKILRSYLMLSANDESEMEAFSENSSCSSGEYSDSGASAFVDLL